jgi:pilus assembly protein Flp/PilA
MPKFVPALKKFFTTKEAGATAVEYGIMVAAIAAVIIATVILVGADVEKAFQVVLSGLNTLPGV